MNRSALAAGLAVFAVVLAGMLALGLLMHWERDASSHRGIPVELEAEDD